MTRRRCHDDGAPAAMPARRRRPTVVAVAVILAVSLVLAGCSSHSPRPEPSTPRPTPSTTATSTAATPTPAGGSSASSIATTVVTTAVPTELPVSTAVTSAGGVVTVTDSSSGQTVSLHVGQHLRVVLRSTYWTFAPPSPSAVLSADGPAVLAVDNDCVPGGGCGTVTQNFAAVTTGRAAVTANRSSCGEALACTPQQARFSLTVQVSG